jgi:hypothetical protein
MVEETDNRRARTLAKIAALEETAEPANRERGEVDPEAAR